MNTPDAIADALLAQALHLLRSQRSGPEAPAIAEAQLSALAVLVERGALTLGALAQAERVRAPSMSRTVDALERHGLVRRARDKRDRRVVYAVATREGSRMLEETRLQRLRGLAQAIEGLDEAEQDVLARACDILGQLLSDATPRRS